MRQCTYDALPHSEWHSKFRPRKSTAVAVERVASCKSSSKVPRFFLFFCLTLSRKKPCGSCAANIFCFIINISGWGSQAAATLREQKARFKLQALSDELEDDLSNLSAQGWKTYVSAMLFKQFEKAVTAKSRTVMASVVKRLPPKQDLPDEPNIALLNAALAAKTDAALGFGS